jgi:hypothetical protein
VQLRQSNIYKQSRPLTAKSAIKGRSCTGIEVMHGVGCLRWQIYAIANIYTKHI